MGTSRAKRQQIKRQKQRDARRNAAPQAEGVSQQPEAIVTTGGTLATQLLGAPPEQVERTPKRKKTPTSQHFRPRQGETTGILKGWKEEATMASAGLRMLHQPTIDGLQPHERDPQTLPLTLSKEMLVSDHGSSSPHRVYSAQGKYIGMHQTRHAGCLIAHDHLLEDENMARSLLLGTMNWNRPERYAVLHTDFNILPDGRERIAALSGLIGLIRAGVAFDDEAIAMPQVARVRDISPTPDIQAMAFRARQSTVDHLAVVASTHLRDDTTTFLGFATDSIAGAEQGLRIAQLRNEEGPLQHESIHLLSTFVDLSFYRADEAVETEVSTLLARSVFMRSAHSPLQPSFQQGLSGGMDMFRGRFDLPPHIMQ